MKRTETDSLGSVEIDEQRYWGPQTERARQLFRIGTERFPTGLIRALGLQKQAAAERTHRPTLPVRRLVSAVGRLAVGSLPNRPLRPVPSQH